MQSPFTTNRTLTIWRSRLSSALRTAFACSIVGCITLYGPLFVQQQIRFPAISYVTVILIVSEATLGDALRGCWYAVFGTFQGVIPGILILWRLGSARFSISTAVLAVTLSTFVVVLPESTHVITKRIALTQIVIVYAVTSVHGVCTGVVMHPLQVGVSTLLGAVASVVALVIPYPRFSCYEVKDKCKQLKENASERVNHYVNAFCPENNSSAVASLSQAKVLTKTGSILLKSIKLKQESTQWERPQCMSGTCYTTTIDKLQALEISLWGMEIVLASCPPFPVRVPDDDLKVLLLSLKENVGLTLKRSNFYVSKESSTVTESKEELSDTSLQAIVSNQNDLPSLFFLFCMKLVNNELTTNRPLKDIAKDLLETRVEEPINSKCATKGLLRSWDVYTKRLMLALKCSFSLGLAVLFGMIFNKENGYWSGLAVSVGMGFGREATFKLANLKAQGLVLGTIYGVLSCFIFERYSEIRFLSLLPWIIFTSFLRCNQMYGPAGATSAVIGALIILGRKNYGPPSEFAIVRITEAFIGITCSIMVELLLRPTRASALAKIQLSHSLMTFHECVDSIAFHVGHGNKTSVFLSELTEKKKKLKEHVSELGELIEEAKTEPNFWFLAFNSGCYTKLLGSLSRTIKLLYFINHAMEFLVQETERFKGDWKELQKSIHGDLDVFKKSVCSSIKCLEEVTQIKCLVKLEAEIVARGINYELELGKSPNANRFKFSPEDGDVMEKLTSCFVQHSREIIEKVHDIQGGEELKGQMVLCSSAIAFCIGRLMKEIKELEMSVSELVQWENPSSTINLNEIHCKIKALHT